MIVPQNSNVNNFENPDKLPTLEPGEMAKFRITTIYDDLDHPGTEVVPFLTLIKPKVTIYDPTSSKRRQITMANVTEEYFDGKFKIDHPAFRGGLSMGYKILRGDIPMEANEYQFLMLHDANGSNPNRNKNVPVLFELIDEARIAKDAKQKRDLKIDAINTARSLKDSDVKRMAASLNWDQEENIIVLRNNLESMAENDPEEFTRAINDRNKEMKIQVKEAFDEDIVFYDAMKRKFCFRADGSTLFSTKDTVAKKEYVNVLTDFFVSDIHSRNSFDLMVSRTKGKKELIK